MKGAFVLWAAETKSNNHYWALSTTINRFKSCFKSELSNNNSKKTQNNFIARQCSTTRCKIVKDMLSAFQWEIFLYAAYSSELCSFRLSYFEQRGFADQHFKTYEEIKKWLDEWFASKDKHFFIAEFTYCQKSRKKLAMENILNKI